MRSRRLSRRVMVAIAAVGFSAAIGLQLANSLGGGAAIERLMAAAPSIGAAKAARAE